MPLTASQPQARPQRVSRSRPAPPPRVPDARATARRRDRVRLWLRAVRVRQWVKNLLVLGAPAAAGVLGTPAVLGRVAETVLAFCLLASGAYLLNDVHDADEDRRHPRKRHRPVASGAIAVASARRAGIGLLVAGLLLALAVSWHVAVVAVAYAVLNVGYTRWLRRLALADIAVIAGVFVLRAAAGAAAAQVPISRSFLVLVCSGAMFVAAGKRYADFVDPDARRSRAVLEHYSSRRLRTIIAISWMVALGAYCAWSLGPAGASGGLLRQLTVAPFALGLLRYVSIVARGRGGAPELVLFADRVVQLAAAAWLTLFALGG
jgi:decaprenyl-phosphate phosphoribosyltransferase